MHEEINSNISTPTSQLDTMQSLDNEGMQKHLVDDKECCTGFDTCSLNTALLQSWLHDKVSFLDQLCNLCKWPHSRMTE